MFDLEPTDFQSRVLTSLGRINAEIEGLKASNNSRSAVVDRAFDAIDRRMGTIETKLTDSVTEDTDLRERVAKLEQATKDSRTNRTFGIGGLLAGAGAISVELWTRFING